MISVLLPFRNSRATLHACLASIRNQTFRKFEIIAINDRSDDGSERIVAHWPDSRVRLLDNPGAGLVDALNFGLRQARYPLVARMDDDDLMRPNRLGAQYAMMQRNPELDVVGSRVALFPACLVQNGYREYIRWQNEVLDPGTILSNRFVESPLAHPSVLFRKQAVLDAGAYRAGDFPEDYELWLRLLELGAKLAKHPSVLLDWRESPGRLSRTHPAYYRTAFDRLRADYLVNVPALHTRPVAFWGAGRKTRLRAQVLIGRGIRPCCWIDIDPRKIGNRIGGVPVRSPSYLQPGSLSVGNGRPFVLIYVTNHGARDLIHAELEQMGYVAGEDFLAVG